MAGKLTAMFKNYFSIGKKRSPDKLLKALCSTKSVDWETKSKNDSLLDGAVEAFHEGRPENIQKAFLNAESIKNWHYRYPALTILQKVAAKSNDKATDINRTIALIPEHDREAILSKALNDAVRKGIGGETFYALLLEAGADANAKIDGYAGAILATAASNKVPISVIELLVNKGASFKDACTTMHSLNYDPASINNLKHFEKQITGGAAEEADVSDILREMQEQIRVLTEKLEQCQHLPPHNGQAARPLPKI
jgi:hypothetical protein